MRTKFSTALARSVRTYFVVAVMILPAEIVRASISKVDGGTLPEIRQDEEKQSEAIEGIPIDFKYYSQKKHKDLLLDDAISKTTQELESTSSVEGGPGVQAIRVRDLLKNPGLYVNTKWFDKDERV